MAKQRNSDNPFTGDYEHVQCEDHRGCDKDASKIVSHGAYNGLYCKDHADDNR